MDGITMDMLQPIKMKAPPGPIPDGMKVVALQDPNQLNFASPCPALGVGSFTLWPMSYMDNRVSFGMVMYDPQGEVIASLEKPGARYVTQITTTGSGTDGSVTVWGQANQTVNLTPVEIDQLLTAGPVVQ